MHSPQHKTQRRGLFSSRVLRKFAFGLWLTLGSGCPSTPAVIVREATPPPQVDMSLGQDDVFEVRVYGEAELTGTYRVSADGTIDFPLIGRLAVRGQTTAQVSDALTDKLRAYLKQPQVTVFLKEVHSKKVVLIGQVRSPGTINFVEGMTLEQAISMVGGLTPMAARDRVRVTRVLGGKAETLVVNFKAIAEGSQTFFLQPGDTVSVDERLF
ncbi:MAG TPA: polysaccharide biosynthesis/export family protein [Pseudomonadota bacterium]|nr:polysaccharide biosynthesis/export family protein [Pseudomonadota bacterium]